MTIDHIGYAVKRMDKAIVEFGNLGFKFEDIINDHDRNVKICFGSNEQYRIELVSPLLKNMSCPIDGYLSKTGPIAYHFCYKSEDLEKDIEALEQQGFRMIIEPKFAIAFSSEPNDYKRVAFFQGVNIGIFEIVETTSSSKKSGGGIDHLLDYGSFDWSVLGESRIHIYVILGLIECEYRTQFEAICVRLLSSLDLWFHFCTGVFKIRFKP